MIAAHASSKQKATVSLCLSVARQALAVFSATGISVST
jgi:hypothetical protein